MATKILTVVPLLALSGLFFAAGITQAGVLFVVFAAVVMLAYLRGDRSALAQDQPEALEIRDRAGPGSGPGGIGLP